VERHRLNLNTVNDINRLSLPKRSLYGIGWPGPVAGGMVAAMTRSSWTDRPVKHRATPGQAPRKRQPFPNVENLSSRPLMFRAFHWVCPWRRDNFPGLSAVICATVGGFVPRSTSDGWRFATNGPPIWAARSVADQIHARAMAGLALAEELRAYADAKERHHATRDLAAPLRAYMARKRGAQAPPIA